MQNFVNILIPYSICLHMSKQKTKSTFLIYFTRWIVTQASVQNQNVNPFSDAYRPLMSKSHLHDILVNHPHQYQLLHFPARKTAQKIYAGYAHKFLCPCVKFAKNGSEDCFRRKTDWFLKLKGQRSINYTQLWY